MFCDWSSLFTRRKADGCGGEDFLEDGHGHNESSPILEEISSLEAYCPRVPTGEIDGN